MSNAIEIQGLNLSLKGFGLEDINISIPKGVVVGLIGENGAGKTTLLKAMTDQYIPDSGSIMYDGVSLREDPVEVKKNIGVVYDSLFYPASMKPSKTAKIISRFYDDFDMGKWHELMKKFELNEKKAPINFSKGMQMKYMFTFVFARNPKVLILDEPTAGMDPSARAELIELVQDYMMDEEHSVIFSTHITTDLDKIADYIALVSEGRLTVFEEKEKLLSDYAIVQVDKDRMNDDIRTKLTGIKENSFGYVGLLSDRSLISEGDGIKFARPTVEDLVVYGKKSK